MGAFSFFHKRKTEQRPVDATPSTQLVTNEKSKMIQRFKTVNAKINVADLLGRDTVPMQSPEAYTVLSKRIILVTGAAGSIGSELCWQLLDYEPASLIALDTNETGLFELAESLQAHPYASRLILHIGDITNATSMKHLFNRKRPEVVFHVAAYKHVPLLEEHPAQAIRTNTLATYQLCCLAQEYEVARFVFISTDKAADPKSILGASKRVGEMVIQSMATPTSGGTCFCAVRFGNVIGSRGSVVPIFAHQIEQGGPVTVTDPEATRYFMTIPEACDLVILTAALAEQGELYLLDMGQPVRIVDLAMKMIQSSGLCVGEDISLVYTGLRPGERLHEILVASDEQLTPTVHDKIMCITHEGSTLEFTTITQSMQFLSDLLLEEQHDQLKKYLFEISQLQSLTSTR
jgi:FlaA1/EpsC-like NDP-sugar epimerase